jgi:hypothetical protein
VVNLAYTRPWVYPSNKNNNRLGIVAMEDHNTSPPRHQVGHYMKNTHGKWYSTCLSKCETLSSGPSTTKKQKNILGAGHGGSHL